MLVSFSCQRDDEPETTLDIEVISPERLAYKTGKEITVTLKVSASDGLDRLLIGDQVLVKKWDEMVKEDTVDYVFVLTDLNQTLDFKTHE